MFNYTDGNTDPPKPLHQACSDLALSLMAPSTAVTHEEEEEQKEGTMDDLLPVRLCTRRMKSWGFTWIIVGDLRYTITGERLRFLGTGFLIISEEVLQLLFTVRGVGFGPCICTLLMGAIAAEP